MQKVPGERYVYKFLPDTMQAVHPFSNQLALGYNQPDGKFLLDKSGKCVIKYGPYHMSHRRICEIKNIFSDLASSFS